MIDNEIAQGSRLEFLEAQDGFIRFYNRLCVPKSHLVVCHQDVTIGGGP